MENKKESHLRVVLEQAIEDDLVSRVGERAGLAGLRIVAEAARQEFRAIVPGIAKWLVGTSNAVTTCHEDLLTVQWRLVS